MVTPNCQCEDCVKSLFEVIETMKVTFERKTVVKNIAPPMVGAKG